MGSRLRLLLDTHALIWWLAGEEALSASARDAIADEGNEIAVSAASAMEIAREVPDRQTAGRGRAVA